MKDTVGYSTACRDKTQSRDGGMKTFHPMPSTTRLRQYSFYGCFVCFFVMMAIVVV